MDVGMEPFLGVLVLLLLCASIQAAAAAEEYEVVAQWGSEGTGIGHFSGLTGIAADTSGNVYTSEATGQYHSRVQRFTSNGGFVTTWDRNSTEVFFDIKDIAVDGSGSVYVYDMSNSDNKDLYIFTPDGVFLRGWKGRGQALAIDAAGTIYTLHVVHVSENPHPVYLSAYSPTGEPLRGWSLAGTGDGEFVEPGGLAADAAGNLYVADTGNNRVQKISPNGEFLVKWGRNGGDCTPGAADGEFNAPARIAIDSHGDIYVADTGNNRVQKFRPDGTFVTKWGGTGTGDGQFDSPIGIAVDGTGAVYVADGANNRVQKFAPALAPDFSASPRTGYIPLSVRFTDTTTGNPTSWHWDFGDGQSSTAKSPSHTYSAPGLYTVRLTVGNAFWSGRTATKTNCINVLPLYGGLIRVQAEDYNPGGEGVGYHDTTPGNSGGAYRADNVDIAPLGARGYVVTRIAGGEWTQYQVWSGAAESHTYPLSLRVAGWAAGQTITATMPGMTSGIEIAVPNTGSADAYAYANATLRLQPGLNTIRFTYHGSAMNFDYFTLDPAGTTPIWTIPGGAGPPTWVTEVGKFDDVNGNGRKDFADVVLYFNQMSWIAANEPVTAFDFNGNGRIDFADVVRLFTNL